MATIKSCLCNSHYCTDCLFVLLLLSLLFTFLNCVTVYRILHIVQSLLPEMCFSKTSRLTALLGQTNLDVDTNNSCTYEELEKHVARSSNDFALIQQNIRGINSKIGDIKHLIENTYESGYPDCILLCETWLGPHSPTVKIAGYNFVHTDRIDKKGGGVGILLSDRIKHKDRSDLKLDNQECKSCFLEVKTKNKPIIIGSIY